jgi:hypothetical protein
VLPHGWGRKPDVLSSGVSIAYVRGGREMVLVHLLRDVCEMILMAGKPDGLCENWCLDVLREDRVALNEIFGTDEYGRPNWKVG